MVQLAPGVADLLNNWMNSYNFWLESGGILIGKLLPVDIHESACKIEITDITAPQKFDKRLPLRFIRAQAGHQDIMDKLWEESGFEKCYLGEWHTHKEACPQPSGIDIRGWKKISSKKQNSPWMLFSILGQKKMRLWTIHNDEIRELTHYAE